MAPKQTQSPAPQEEEWDGRVPGFGETPSRAWYSHVHRLLMEQAAREQRQVRFEREQLELLNRPVAATPGVAQFGRSRNFVDLTAEEQQAYIDEESARYPTPPPRALRASQPQSNPGGLVSHVRGTGSMADRVAAVRLANPVYRTATAQPPSAGQASSAGDPAPPPYAPAAAPTDVTPAVPTFGTSGGSVGEGPVVAGAVAGAGSSASLPAPTEPTVPMPSFGNASTPGSQPAASAAGAPPRFEAPPPLPPPAAPPQGSVTLAGFAPGADPVVGSHATAVKSASQAVCSSAQAPPQSQHGVGGNASRAGRQGNRKWSRGPAPRKGQQGRSRSRSQGSNASSFATSGGWSRQSSVGRCSFHGLADDDLGVSPAVPPPGC